MTVSRIEVEILRRTELSAYTPIACNFGAGGDVGFRATVDNRRPDRKTLLTYNDEQGDLIEDVEMPPASFTVKDNKGTSTGIVAIESRSDFLYHGILKVYANVNGEPRIITLGTADEPYRWVTPSADPSKRVAWDPLSSSWVPFNYGETPPGV